MGSELEEFRKSARATGNAMATGMTSGVKTYSGAGQAAKQAKPANTQSTASVSAAQVAAAKAKAEAEYKAAQEAKKKKKKQLSAADIAMGKR
jgi:hypothetical protein